MGKRVIRLRGNPALWRHARVIQKYELRTERMWNASHPLIAFIDININNNNKIQNNIAQATRGRRVKTENVLKSFAESRLTKPMFFFSYIGGWVGSCWLVCRYNTPVSLRSLKNRTWLDVSRWEGGVSALSWDSRLSDVGSSGD